MSFSAAKVEDLTSSQAQAPCLQFSRLGSRSQKHRRKSIMFAVNGAVAFHGRPWYQAGSPHRRRGRRTASATREVRITSPRPGWPQQWLVHVVAEAVWWTACSTCEHDHDPRAPSTVHLAAAERSTTCLQRLRRPKSRRPPPTAVLGAPT